MQDGSLQAAVVGAGTMGTTLAKLMAAHGVKVTVVDTNPKVLEASRLNVGESAEIIRFTTNLEVAKSADFVIESVTENVAIKRKVVAQIESEVADTCIIVTNTSGIPIDDIGSAMRVPQRFLGTHFFNPADIIPAVEVVPGSHTEAAVVEKVCGWLKRWGNALRY